MQAYRISVLKQLILVAVLLSNICLWWLVILVVVLVMVVVVVVIGVGVVLVMILLKRMP